MKMNMNQKSKRNYLAIMGMLTMVSIPLPGWANLYFNITNNSYANGVEVQVTQVTTGGFKIYGDGNNPIQLGKVTAFVATTSAGYAGGYFSTVDMSNPGNYCAFSYSANSYGNSAYQTLGCYGNMTEARGTCGSNCYNTTISIKS